MKKHISSALRHISRAPYQTTAAVLTTTITLFITSLFIVIAAGSSQILNYFEKRPQVFAFFKDDTSKEEIEKVQKKISDSGLATNIRFVSKEEAFDIYREHTKDDPLLMEFVTANILPPSLEIEAKDPSALKEIASLVRNEPGIDEVLFQEDIVATLITWTKSIRLVGISLIFALALQAIIVILTVISTKIALKKEEIEILNLIGASPWYIRAPFLLEGIFYGLFGGFLAWIATLIAILYSTPFLVTFLAGLPILPIPLMFYAAVLCGLLLIGSLLGSFGSYFALRRFLK